MPLFPRFAFAHDALAQCFASGAFFESVQQLLFSTGPKRCSQFRHLGSTGIGFDERDVDVVVVTDFGDFRGYPG